MAAVITEEERVRARHHLGYLSVEAAQTFVLGIPAAVQTQFMIEGALNRILPQAVELFRQLLCRLDGIEAEVFCGVDLASVDKLDSIDIRSDRLETLAKYYLLAAEALSNLLGVPRNPWDMRTWLQGASGAINVSVIG